MSRIGKKPIEIPENVEIKIEDGNVTVKGPLGELKRQFKDSVSIKQKEGFVVLNPERNSKAVFSLWGTYSSHIKNMIEGATKGFEKKLVVVGIGYKAQTEGKNLVLNLGFSHPIKMTIPEGLKVVVEKNIISISGINKEEVGDFSAKIRILKKPEPYKGKGIRYENEVVRRKAGKKAATTA
ncbi:MAG TPA: 50S ribosomal protein L6 [Candidatus Campbellbacteria bacterium]|nr:50S ribosomal protein L6 [Candidatus Campbellbacteria bacterium]